LEGVSWLLRHGSEVGPTAYDVFFNTATGTRVEKINSKRGSSQPNGAHGTITTSLGAEMWHGQMTHGYLVVWDGCKAAAFVVGDRIRKLAKE
jgi:hypothetical protein